MNTTLLGFIRKELTQSLRDPRMKFLLFVTPLIQMTLFGVAISNEVKNVRLAAYFDSRDTLMVDAYQRALAGGWFKGAPTLGKDPFKLIQDGDADAALVAPPLGLTTELTRGSGTVQLLTNATNVLQAQAVENYLRSILSDVLRTDLHYEAPPPPIEFKLRVLFNPSLETSIFMVPGVMCTLMVMTTMMLSMAALVREKEAGTMETLLAAPVSKAEVIFGKTIPYVIIGMSNLPLTLSVALFVFHVPMRGSFLALVLATFVFVCTCVSMGALISTFCQNQQQSALAGFLFMFPAMMFSGLMFPLENMPTVLRFLATLDPLSHYMGLLRNIMLKGGGAQYYWTHVSILCVCAMVCMGWNFRRFQTTLV